MDVPSAVAALKQGLARTDRVMINDSARTLLAAEAPLGRSWKAVAQALASNGEIGLAEAALRSYRAAEGNNATSQFDSAVLLAQMARLDAAGQLLAAVPATVPDRSANTYLKGSIALNRGEREVAERHFREALAVNPRSGQTWLSLTEALDFAAQPDLAAALERQWQEPDANPFERANLGYAVGRSRHQQRDHEGALAAFAEGAAARIEHDRGEPAAPIVDEAALTGWSPELIARTNAAIRVDHRRAIFVTGLPRSGTTLVEQILASSPEVVDGAELGLFRLLEQDIGGSDAASFERWLGDGGDPNALVETYLHLATERFGPDGRFVDKSLEASHYMGLLLALFPRSPLVWMRRDPIDCGWSVFRTYFARGVRWGWDLDAIGCRLALEDRLFAHWTAAMPGRITLGDYAALVADAPAQIEWLAAAVGLDLDPAMLSPHLARRTVLTASVSQVREPINRKGLGVAEPYREWLGPMLDAYARR